MSEPSDDAALVKQEYEKLSKEASSLASNLARRRADIALMRAEAATVAVSLESAKDQLDTALRKESIIRSNAQQSPQKEKSLPDFLPDHGLVRALIGQLEVTRESVKAAEGKRASLRDEILQLEQSTSQQNQLDQVQAQVATKMNISPEDGSDNKADKRKTFPDERNAAKLQKEMGSSSACDPAEENALHILQESAESQSSFRSDHARVWRDITMPNLTMVTNEARMPTMADTSLGVVTERIFEGVACFTPNNVNKGQKSAGKEGRITNCGEASRPSKSISELVSQQYSSLATKTKENETEVQLIAPKVALEKVTNLVRTQSSDVAKRPRPSASFANGEENIALDNTNTEEGNTNASNGKGARTDQEAFPRRSDVDFLAAKIPMRRSAKSEILTDEHFACIILDGVPARFQESSLDLVYSTEVHGISLHTLYHRATKSSPTLVVIRDTKNRIFGCYATQAWKSSATRYYGSGESFVFGTPNKKSLPKVYKWSRANSFFQFTAGSFLAMGGGAGSHFALWIDEDLLMGTTSACSTFASPPLVDTEECSGATTKEFKILSLELWSFVAQRRH